MAGTAADVKFCTKPETCLYFSGGTCDYLLITGHARSLICPSGRRCTVKTTHTGYVRSLHLTKEEQEAVRKLYDQGFSDPVIARAVNSTRQIVRHWRLKNNLPPNAKGGRKRKSSAEEAAVLQESVSKK